VMNL